VIKGNKGFVCLTRHDFPGGQALQVPGKDNTLFVFQNVFQTAGMAKLSLFLRLEAGTTMNCCRIDGTDVPVEWAGAVAS
jgi:hypothetical protein